MNAASRALLAVLCIAHAACAVAAGERFKLLDHAAWRGGGTASEGTAPELLDRKTRLVWRRTLAVGRPGARSPYDSVEFFTWDEAMQAARFVAQATGEPWRMATIAELSEMFQAVRHERLDERGLYAFAPPRPSELRQVWFWSGTPHRTDSKFAWYLHCIFEKPFYYYREYQGRVSLVRPATRADFEAGPCVYVERGKGRRGRELACPPDPRAQR